MAIFTYSAKTSDGKRVGGTIRAGDRTTAQDELRKKRLTVVSISAVKDRKKGYGLFGPPKPHVKPKDIAVVTRQLATMISAGIPLLEGLEILEEQAADKGFRIAFGRIIEKIRAGTDFSTALSEYPKVFGKIYINMVRAGEASGQLDTILVRLAEYLEATEALKREIRSAMTYPVVSLFLILSITIGLLVGIVPKFKEIFNALGGEKNLPAPTKILLDISDFMQQQFLLMIGICVVFIIAFLMYKKTKRGEWQWHWVILHMPVFGPLFRKVAISRFARTFSTLLGSGVPMLAALDIVGATAGNRLLEDAVAKAKDKVTKGEPLGEPLAATKVFPPMVTRMIAIGEKSGALEKLLGKISEFYDQEVKTMVEALTSLIEPIMIAVMGVLVGGIVLAIFLPILKVQEMLTKK